MVKQQIAKLLDGKKTYLAAVILALTGLYQLYYTGELNIEIIQILAGSFGLASFRKAL